MQKLFTEILNYTYRHITCHISRTLRISLALLCIALINAIFFFDQNQAELQIYIPERIIAAIIPIITIFSIDSELKPITWNSRIYHLFIMFGLSIIIISFIHKTGLLILAVEYLVLLPALYFVWINRGDTRTFYNGISVIIVTEAIINFMYCFVLSIQAHPLTVIQDRYAGNTDGPNQLGELGAIILIAGLYFYVSCQDSIEGCLLASAGIGIGISYVILSGCRTATLAEIVCILSAVIYSIKLHILKNHLTKKRLLHIVLTVLLTSVIILLGLQLDNIYYKRVQEQDNSLSSTVLSQDLFQTAFQGFDDTSVLINTDISPNEEHNTISILNRFSYNGDLDALSSGRIAIWIQYIDNFKPFGNDDYVEPDKSPEGKISLYPAHNNFIEFTYRCGYLTGVIYLALFVIIGVKGLILLFGKKHTEYYKIFCIMCIGAFSVFSMLEWCHSLARPMTCLYYLSLAPIMGFAISPSRD